MNRERAMVDDVAMAGTIAMAMGQGGGQEQDGQLQGVHGGDMDCFSKFVE